VLLLRHSGLRIGDAVTLERGRIADDKPFVYTAKTGAPVYVPFVLTALEAVPKISEKYFDFYFVQPEVMRKKRDALNQKLKDAGKPPMK